MEFLQQLLGIGTDSLNWYQAALRAVIVYFATLLMVRIGEKRFLGKNTAFDFIIGIILGSVVSRAVNSTSTILPSLLAGFVLIGLHWLLARLTFQSDRLGNIVKGTRRQIMENGEILWNAMKKSHVTREDLMQQVRTGNSTEDISKFEKAYLERSGDISLIPYNKTPKVVEVKVEDGVQTVRIVMES